ncbi:MAG: hypothetical protein LBC04_00900 [Holosporaceae bacterium]|nr:hypothetical protein [Holosporaceae bacterium]
MIYVTVTGAQTHDSEVTEEMMNSMNLDVTDKAHDTNISFSFRFFREVVV